MDWDKEFFRFTGGHERPLTPMLALYSLDSSHFARSLTSYPPDR